MSVLLLRLAGPMQSWGTQSRFTVRDTGRDPSKSGVLGLLCAALGRPRHHPLDDLTELEMAVRADCEGEFQRDYQTAGAGCVPGVEKYGVVHADGKGRRTVDSNRYYLADADFLVGLGGPADLLRTLSEAVRRPVWPLYLGRKAFVPGCPVWIPHDLQEADPESALRAYPWQRPCGEPPGRLRLVLESATPEEADGVRQDVPLSFARRQFTVRHVRTAWIDAPDDCLPQPEEF